MRASTRLHHPSRLLVPLLLAGCLATGCQTTVGNYLANRGRDLGECFLLQYGAGIGLGVDVKLAGALHASAGFACYYPFHSMGWYYGELRPGDVRSGFGHLPGEGDLGILIAHASTRSFDGTKTDHLCYAILPALLSKEEGVWLWGDMSGRPDRVAEQAPLADGLLEGETLERLERAVARKARVHAFDIEAGVFLGVVGVRAGFSPGQFADFLLGWVGIDIAGDDRGIETEKRAGERVGEEL